MHAYNERGESGQNVWVKFLFKQSIISLIPGVAESYHQDNTCITSRKQKVYTREAQGPARISNVTTAGQTAAEMLLQGKGPAASPDTGI